MKASPPLLLSMLILLSSLINLIASAGSNSIDYFRITYHVTDDDRDRDSRQYVEVSKRGRVLASWESGTSETWDDWDSKSFDIKPNYAEQSLTGYNIKLRHSPNGNDNFHFDLTLRAFASDGSQLFSQTWTGQRHGKGSTEINHGLTAATREL